MASAIVTGAAALIAALTYFRQVSDKHAEDVKRRRQQAETVTVNITRYLPLRVDPRYEPEERLNIQVRNDGTLAIFNVALVTTQKGNGRDGKQQLYTSVLAGESESFLEFEQQMGGAYATFTDTAGVRWKRWHNGELEEIPHYPKPGK
ncbi:hypothetical protein [Arthrobacter sp. NicSoilC5]|uniref:hypothetical protein n=1 Tax=Arthrobacter sp. NicSoilC5 TaxID=2831000 RepID=UPI001CC33A38|nr:hypothetical protein [Arthrobacter sp. NicSoilC5]